LKRLCSLCLCPVLLLLLVMPARAVSTSASSAILIDGESGRVLYEQNAHEERYIASITKLMTALVAMESGHDLDEVVTIKKEYTGAEGSSMYLREGEKLTLEALMYGLLLASGNDAALAVAGYCAGTVEEFVSLMNRKAVLLGMENTRFLNPSGLTQEGHMSTAADMAKLAAACMKNEKNEPVDVGYIVGNAMDFVVSALGFDPSFFKIRKEISTEWLLRTADAVDAVTFGG